MTLTKYLIKMKKYILPVLIILVISCNKDKKRITVYKNETKVVTTTDTNGVKKTDSSVVYQRTVNGKSIVAKNEVKKYEYIYEATDGKQANVTFTHYADKSFVLIKRNVFNIELPQTRSDAKSATFEKGDIKVIAEGNKLNIYQNGKIIELTRNK